ncbi:MAG: stage II sporulation protein M [Candidatus Dormibacteria bacterium]
MTADQFVARRQPAWVELEAAIRRTKSGIRSMPARDLERFGVLYRHAASDLAIARRDFAHEEVTRYLGELCARAHPLVYRGEGLRPAAIPHFYAVELPRLFRASWPYMVASLLLLVAGAAAGWAAVTLRPDLAPALVPSSLFDQMARGRIGGDIPDAGIAFGFITTNNIRVAVIACCGGVLLALPTVFILLSNGWVLGTLAGAIHQGGFDLAFWSLILPHGVLELSVIVFAGGAGLMLGDSFLRPGLASRSDAFAGAARRAFRLALGFAFLLPICGMIESFISPSGLPRAAKLGVALLTGVLLYAWLLLAGRQRGPAAALPVLGESAVEARPETTAA